MKSIATLLSIALVAAAACDGGSDSSDGEPTADAGPLDAEPDSTPPDASEETPDTERPDADPDAGPGDDATASDIGVFPDTTLEPDAAIPLVPSCGGRPVVDLLALAVADEQGRLVYHGTTRGQGDRETSRCSGEGAADQRMFFEPEEDGEWVVRAEGQDGFIPVLGGQVTGTCELPYIDHPGIRDGCVAGAPAVLVEWFSPGLQQPLVVDGLLAGSEGDFTLTLERRAIAEPGGPCGGPSLIGCPGNEICSLPDEAGESRCVAPAPPTLLNAAAFVNETTGEILLRAEGESTARDLFALNDTSVVGTDPRIRPQSVTWDADRFVALWRGGRGEPIAAADVHFAIAAEGVGLSEVIDVEGVATITAEADGACDPFGIQSQCPDGLVCEADSDTSPGICAPRSTACPAALAPLAELSAGPGPVWSISTLGPASPGSRTFSRCGGLGSEDVYTFTAPADGTYRFELLEPWSLAGVVYVRTDCNSLLLEDELACGAAEAGTHLPAGAETTLAAGQTVHVFADGGAFFPDRLERYELRAFAPHVPVTTSVEVGADAESGRLWLRAEVEEPDGDLDSVRVFLLDGAGESLGGLGPRFAFVETQVEQIDGRARLDLNLDLFHGPLGRFSANDVARVRVAFTDRSGRTSEAVEVPVRSPQAVPAGAVCEPFLPATRCPADQVCVDQGEAATCVATELECPADWTDVFTDLNTLPSSIEGGVQVYEFELSGRDVAHGTCRAPDYGAEAAIRYAPPSDGVWRIEISRDDGEPVAYFARRHCGAEARADEVGCVAETQGLPADRTALEVGLEVGQPIFLFPSVGDPTRLRITVDRVGDRLLD